MRFDKAPELGCGRERSREDDGLAPRALRRAVAQVGPGRDGSPGATAIAHEKQKSCDDYKLTHETRPAPRPVEKERTTKKNMRLRAVLSRLLLLCRDRVEGDRATGEQGREGERSLDSSA